MMPRRQGWLGVDFGADAVKVAQLEQRAGEVRLVRAAIVRRDVAWDADIGPDTSPVSSLEPLRTAIALARGTGGASEAAAVLSMRLYDLRSLHAAGVGAAAVESVSQELASIYGADTPNRIYDFWSTQIESTRANSENTAVLTLSLPWAEQVCDDLEDCRLYGETIDGPPLAFARALTMNDISTERPLLVLDWGYNRATVSVVRREQPLFVRCLRDSGYRNVLEQVAKSLGLTDNEAQKVLTEFGLPESPQGTGEDLQRAIADIVAEPMRAITDELHRTLSFLQSNRRGSEPEEAVLFGGGATMRNADRYIERATSIRTQNFRLGNQSTFETDAGVFPVPLLGAAIGLSSLAWRSA